MFSKKIAGAIILFAGMMSPVFGQSPIEEIARINESIVVLNAKNAELEVRKQIAIRQSELEKLGGLSKIASSEEEILPVVKGIEGIDGKLFATLIYERGIEQTVKAGEKIRGNWTVTGIDVRSVTIKRGEKQVRLVFGSEPARQESQPVSLPVLSPRTPSAPLLMGQ